MWIWRLRFLWEMLMRQQKSLCKLPRAPSWWVLMGHVKKNNFVVVEELGGHGVGYSPHEDPHIANYGERGEGVKLRAGMVLALEPIVNEGTRFVKILSDGYTFVTRDHKRSAHFEHTILVTDGNPEILTNVSF